MTIGLSLGLLLLRLAVGLAVASHGAQKLFGTFGGYGLAGTGGFFEGKLGFHPGKTFAALAGLGELCGGLLVAVGLFTPLGAALVVGVMATAAVTVHLPKGFYADKGGFELPYAYAAAVVALAFSGPGRWSLDWAFRLVFRLGGVGWGLFALLVGLVGALCALAIRAGQRRRTGAPVAA